MKKPKYKEVQRKFAWLVVAEYQPGSMWMRPEDTKRSRHVDLADAMKEVNKHQENGASTIEVLQDFFTLEMTR